MNPVGKKNLKLRILFLATIGALIPTSSMAIWNLWPPQVEVQAPVPQTQKLNDFRDADCSVGDGETTRFGENRYMRGVVTKQAIQPETQHQIAAIRLAGTLAQAQQIAAPLLASTDPEIRGYTRIALARLIIARAHSEPGYSAAAADLLSSEALNHNSDALYLRAVLAFNNNAAKKALEFSTAALELEPTYYDAAVLRAISELWLISGQALDCQSAFLRIQQAITPVLESGACPTHVAFFDLAIDRHLALRATRNSQRDMALRRIMLAHVSQNDAVCASTAAAIRTGPFGADCATVLDALACSKPDDAR